MPSTIRSFHETKGSFGCSILKLLGTEITYEHFVVMGRCLQLDCRIQEGLCASSTDNCLLHLGSY